MRNRLLGTAVLGLTALLLVAACGTDPTPTPRPLPTATPVPAAAPTSIPESEETGTRITASQDATLFEDAEGLLADSTGVGLFTGTTNRSAVRRALLAFDVAGEIPAGATITSAKLTMNMGRTSGGSADVAIHRVLTSWAEGPSGAGRKGGGAGGPAVEGDPRGCTLVSTTIHGRAREATSFPWLVRPRPSGDLGATFGRATRSLTTCSRGWMGRTRTSDGSL